jgi:hypothetical protein
MIGFEEHVFVAQCKQRCCAENVDDSSKQFDCDESVCPRTGLRVDRPGVVSENLHHCLQSNKASTEWLPRAAEQLVVQKEHMY